MAPTASQPPTAGKAGPSRRDPEGDAPAVVVDDLVIRYGDTVAVDGLSFAANRSEVTVVLGPNGAGKTSTIEHLEGYRRAAGGTATVLGLDPVRDHRALARRVGLMLQSGGIPTGIRPAEVLRQYAGFFDRPIEPGELLGRVGLDHRARTPFRRLSGGEQKRLSLALALIGRPDVAFLDEPTAGVDLEGRELIRQVVADLAADGVAVVLTTHDLDEAERVADRIIIIDRGQAVAEGTPDELMRAGAGDHLLFGGPPNLDIVALGTSVGATVEEVTRGEYRVDVPPTPANVAAVTAWLAERDLPLADQRAGRQRLDDVLRRLTARTDRDAPDSSPEGPDAAPGRRTRRSRR
ncbi:MAG: ABC transporter ATP-binding protein [Acidimicrobiales bacterium]